MLNFKKRVPKIIFFSFFLVLVLLSLTPIASAVLVKLDLYGTEKFTEIRLPFEYYQRQPNDKFTLIHQGGYRIYDIEKNPNEVVVLGGFRPCIGIAVTDGKKLIVFHKHSTNALNPDIDGSVGQIVRDNLNLDPNNPLLRARIYTTRDDIEWKKNRRSYMHGNKSHDEAVEDIKKTLRTIGIPRKFIHGDIWNLRGSDGELRYADLYLGRYELCEVHIAIRINDLYIRDQIKFTSIDPATEDVFGFKGKMITIKDYVGEDRFPVLSAQGMIDPDTVISYDDIGTKGYQYQRGYYERKIDNQEECFYKKEFNQNEQDVINSASYSTLPFYLIDTCIDGFNKIIFTN